MAATNFIDGTTYIQASWLNDINTGIYNTLIPYQKYLRPTIDLALWGDSLTLGMAPAASAQFSSTRGVYSYGIGGQVSDQVFSRQGSNTVLVTLPSNTIIAAVTPVTLTGITSNLLSANNDLVTRTIDGMIIGSNGGVRGTITRTATGTTPSQVETHTWTRTVAGSAIVIEAESVFIPDPSIGHDFNTTVFWPGRGDFNSDVPYATIQNYIIAAINFLKSQQKRFVLLSCLNSSQEYASNTASTGLTNYPTFASRYAAVITFNRWMKINYPNEFVDLRAVLVRSGTGTGQDAIDAANDVVPTSLRIDGIHLTNAGYTIGTNLINQNLVYRGI